MGDMKIMIGLGNPGPKYQFTRHNVGFQVVDELVADDAKWHLQDKLIFTQVDMVLPDGAQEKIVMVKPQTFMNQSGLVVPILKKKYPQVTLSDWYVVHDDLDIELGQFKIELGHGPQQHNGLASLYEQLGKQFWHVRVGVDGRQGLRQESGSDYVLVNFSPPEKEIIESVKQRVVKELKTVLIQST